jgi:hypothetical protein
MHLEDSANVDSDDETVRKPVKPIRTDLNFDETDDEEDIVENPSSPLDVKIKSYLALELDKVGKEALGPVDALLHWWAAQSKRYPKSADLFLSDFRLSMLARSRLCIPAASASSERIFSDAGNTITQIRASVHVIRQALTLVITEKSRRNASCSRQ